MQPTSTYPIHHRNLRPSRYKGVTWRYIDERYCGPYATIPPTHEVEAEIEMRYRRGGARSVERYLSRLLITCEEARGKTAPFRAREPHNAATVRNLIAERRTELDETYAAGKEDDLVIARWVLAMPGVVDKKSFCEAIRRAGIGKGKSPGDALWRRIQRRAHKYLGPTLPGKYTRLEGFRALVHDLISGRLGG